MIHVIIRPHPFNPSSDSRIRLQGFFERRWIFRNFHVFFAHWITKVIWQYVHTLVGVNCFVKLKY